MFGVKFDNRIHLLGALFLLLLSGTNIYRAATQSITVDEALIYNHFIAHKDVAMETGTPFNTNLGLWLSQLSVFALGTSELSMRLPSLLAGGLYFFCLFRICTLLFPCPGFFLAAITVNSLNPHLLDYFSAARGYGLAVAFLTAAAYCMVRWIKEDDATNWKLPLLAAVALGLSFDSHITAVFPVAALALAFFFIYLSKGSWKLIVPMVAVTAIISLAVLIPSLHQAKAGNVDGVVNSYRDGLKSMINCYLFYKPAILTTPRFVHRQAWLMLPLLLAALLATALRVRNNAIRLFAIAAPLTFLLLYVEPQLLHHGFFSERRLVVTYPLLFIGAPAMLSWLVSRSLPERIASYAGCALLGFLIAAFALQWNVSSYLGWEQDAGTKAAMQMLRSKRPADATETARLGADMYLDQALNFYRETLTLDWLMPITRDSAECQYDFYYVRAENFPRVERFGLKEIYRDKVAGTVLAERSEESLRRTAALKSLGLDKPAACTADVMGKFDHIENSDPVYERAMLRDFMPASPGQWRWTFEHPALLMSAPKKPGTAFTMDFVIHAATFKETGPIRLTVFINGQKIGDKLYTTPEGQSFTAAIPESAFRADGIALVETTQDKYYKAPDDAQKMGYLFRSAVIK